MDQMLRSITARQFQEWLHYAELEPFGNDRIDYLFGSIVQMIANANRGKARKNKPFTLDECTPRFGDRPAPKNMANWQAMKALAKEMVQKDKKPVRPPRPPRPQKTARQHAKEVLETIKKGKGK